MRALHAVFVQVRDRRLNQVAVRIEQQRKAGRARLVQLDRVRGGRSRANTRRNLFRAR